MKDDDAQQEMIPRDYRKSTHDGREIFFKVLGKMQLELESARFSQNDELWQSTVAGVFGKVQPNCPPDEIKDLPAKIEESYRLVAAQRRLRASKLLHWPEVASQYEKNAEELHKLLSEIHDRVHHATRDLMLPLKSGDDDDFDVDKALRGSGT